MGRQRVLRRARKAVAIVDDGNTDPGLRMAAEDRLRAMIDRYEIKPHEWEALDQKERARVWKARRWERGVDVRRGRTMRIRSTLSRYHRKGY